MIVVYSLASTVVAIGLMFLILSTRAKDTGCLMEMIGGAAFLFSFALLVWPVVFLLHKIEKASGIEGIPSSIWVLPAIGWAYIVVTLVSKAVKKRRLRLIESNQAKPEISDYL